VTVYFRFERSTASQRRGRIWS